jgi:peptidyl-prolyl cis-trans isomerase A (cyclophilin A)
MKKIHFETDKGEMVAELYDDDAPETVANFVGLATGEKEWTDPKTNQKHKGEPYFNGLRFHRVVPNFVIQGGDPFTRHDDMKARWGTGGPGFKIKDELSGKKQVHKRGSLSMAHAGPGTGGSQFFICHSGPSHLDRKHTVFGKVISGIEVVDQIREGDKMKKVWVE